MNDWMAWGLLVLGFTPYALLLYWPLIQWQREINAEKAKRRKRKESP